MLTLHLYDSNDASLRKMGYLGIREFFGWRNPDKPGVIWTGVASYQDIKDEILRIGGLGGKIDYLWFHMHGIPGALGFKTGFLSGYPAIDATNIGQLAPACRRAMAPKARVYFLACDLGYGQKGEAFLKAAGPAMLGQDGGVMLAATSVTASEPILGERLPPWAQVRIAQVSPGGAVVISTSSYVAWMNVQGLLGLVKPGVPTPPTAPVLHFR